MNKNPNVLFIAGNWTDTGGRANNYMTELITLFEKKLGCPITAFNGGHINELEMILSNYTSNADIVFYAPNIPCELDKRLNPKDYNFRIVLISFKRNDNRYTFDDLTSQALTNRSDLICEVRKDEPSGRYEMRVFDILGAMWSDFTQDTEASVDALLDRAMEILTFRYYKMKSVRRFIPNPEVNLTEVFEVYRDFGYLLKKLQFGDKPNRVRRHLGEMSFRSKDTPVVSFSNSRNYLLSDTPKTEDFIPTKITGGKVFYAGEKKPHLETGVFDQIFERYHDINYIFHSHCVIDGVNSTENAVTNGSIQEFSEVERVLENSDKKTDLSINLKGHGSLILGSDLEYVQSMFEHLRKRNLPEAV